MHMRLILPLNNTDLVISIFYIHLYPLFDPLLTQKIHQNKNHCLIVWSVWSAWSCKARLPEEKQLNFIENDQKHGPLHSLRIETELKTRKNWINFQANGIKWNSGTKKNKYTFQVCCIIILIIHPHYYRTQFTRC